MLSALLQHSDITLLSPGCMQLRFGDGMCGSPMPILVRTRVRPYQVPHNVWVVQAPQHIDFSLQTFHMLSYSSRHMLVFTDQHLRLHGDC